VDTCKTLSRAARVARQGIGVGKSVAPRQVMRFLFTRGKPGVWAYDVGEWDGRTLDVGRYVELMERAAEIVLDVFAALEHSNKMAMGI
jgi:hypothetical protein